MSHESRMEDMLAEANYNTNWISACAGMTLAGNVGEADAATIAHCKLLIANGVVLTACCVL